MEDLIESYLPLTALSKSDLKEIVGFTVVGSKSLMEKRNELVDIIEGIIENSETLSEAKASLTEADEETADDKDPAPEATEQDVEAIKKALETAKSKAKDEKLIKKIEDIIDYVHNHPFEERDGRKAQDNSVDFGMEKLRNRGFF